MVFSIVAGLCSFYKKIGGWGLVTGAKLLLINSDLLAPATLRTPDAAAPGGRLCRGTSVEIYSECSLRCAARGELASICILCALVSTFAGECEIKKWTAPTRRQLQVLYCNGGSCHCSTGLERNSCMKFFWCPPPHRSKILAPPLYYTVYTVYKTVSCHGRSYYLAWGCSSPPPRFLSLQ